MESASSVGPGEEGEVTESEEEGGNVDLAALVREPQQERSRKTLARIVSAAHALLAEKGADSLTVGAIARRARTSVGSFYARFDGKDELVRYLGETDLGSAMEDWSDRYQETLGEALADAASGEERPPDEIVLPHLRDLTAFLLDEFRTGSPARLEVLDQNQDPAPTRMDRLRTRTLEDLETLYARVAGAGELQREVAARMTLATVRALAREAGEANPGAHPSGEPSHLDSAYEVARAISLYVAAAPNVDRAAVEASEEGGRALDMAHAEHASPEPELLEEAPDEAPEPPPRDPPKGAPDEAPPPSESEGSEEPSDAPEPSEPHASESSPSEPSPSEPDASDERPEASDPDSLEPEEVDPFDVWN